jgi:uncharacterized protein YegL
MMVFRKYKLSRLLLICAIVLQTHAQDVNRQSSYYGIPIAESGVVFLLDVSGSMENKDEGKGTSLLRRGTEKATELLRRTPLGHTRAGGAVADRAISETTKLGAARRELFKALRTLSGLTEFTIITFGSEVKEWPGGLQKAQGGALASAESYALLLHAEGDTPMAEALDLAFAKPRIRTIFLVSDGRPTTGEVLAKVQQIQSQRGEEVVINTVGIGSDQDSALLCSLAKANHGVYVSDGTVACTSNPCPESRDIMTYFRSTNPLYHHYKVSTEICQISVRGCTAQFVFDTMQSETRFGAPTTNRDPVRSCEEFTLHIRVGLADPITIALDPATMSWTNYTRRGHIFHPGQIIRTVRESGQSVVVETFGEGVGDWPTVNKVFGPDIFKEVDRTLKNEVTRRLSSK